MSVFNVDYFIRLKDKLSKPLGKAGRNTDKFNKKFNKTSSTVNKFGGIVSRLVPAFAAFQLLKGATTTIIEFDDKIAELGSILGKSGKDLDFFKKASVDMSRQSTKSAIEIVDAFKLVGSAKPELLKNEEGLKAVTSAAITLSEAGKIAVPEAAQALAGALNQFGLGADQASRAINALAAGSKEGAANIPEITAAIDGFGAVAASSNISLEESVGLIETLAEKNIKASSAGIQLKNIILKLKNAGFGFVNGQFKMNAALEEAKKSLNAIQDPVKRSAEQTKLFGLESTVAGEILLKNISTFERYSKAVTGTSIAFDQAEQNSNTLKASLEKTSNAWDNFVISLEQDKGVISNTFKAFTDSATGFLNALTDINRGGSGNILGTFDSVLLKLRALGGSQSAQITLQALTSAGQNKGAGKTFPATGKGVLDPQFEEEGSIFDRFKDFSSGDVTKTTPDGKPPKDADLGLAGVKANAPKVFNINIEKLIESFKVETQNIKDGGMEVRKIVEQALATAVADLTQTSE